MPPDQATLLEFLRSSQPTPAAKALLKRTMQQFVLDYGWWYEPASLPRHVPLGTPQQCHKNAIDLAMEGDSLVYCEGYALSQGSSLPILHAWVTDGHGKAIDNTWPQPGVAYAGVPFRAGFVTLTALKNDAIGSVLDDYQNGYPLRGDLGDRPDEWLEPRGQGTARVGGELSANAVIVRPETPADHGTIRDILLAAFADHPHSHQTEHLIVEALRADDALNVSLVAEVDGDIVGYIAFSPVTIGGKNCGWFALGPAAVLPAYQRRGIGQALVNGGLKAIRKLGAQGCVLVGEPAFYNRFGFRHNPALQMAGVPPEVVLCLPMGDQMPEGNVTHHPAFSVGE